MFDHVWDVFYGFHRSLVCPCLIVDIFNMNLRAMRSMTDFIKFVN